MPFISITNEGNMKKQLFLLLVLCSVVSAQALKIPYTRYVLPNGLNVLLHEDRSTPTVSVNTWFHVGSGYEKVGRTGFAHLFEHLMFEGSGHVAEGDFDKNERRQSYENRPYGLSEETILKQLFPSGHPYSWPVIGSMADLSAASFEDVVEFFRTYYVPNNASLVISGDIDPKETIKLVEKWFGAIPAGKPVPPQNPAAAKLTEEKIVMLEDRVQLPRLYMTWITPAKFAPGDAEMDVLANVLSGGKNSRLYQKLVYELQIAQDVYAYQASTKLVSQFQIVSTARSGHTLAEIKSVIEQELNKIKAEAPTQREVQIVVNQYEASFLDQLERPGGFSGKADLLNTYYYYAGNPDYANEDLARYKSLSVEDVQFAAQKYLPDNARVVLSIVPKGKTDLAIQPKTEAK